MAHHNAEPDSLGIDRIYDQHGVFAPREPEPEEDFMQDNRITLAEPHTATIPPLSQSRQALMACPHLYRTRVVAGVKEAANPYAQRGTEIHEGVAEYITHLVETRQPSDYGWFEAHILTRAYSDDALDLLKSMKESLIIDPERVLGAEMYLMLDESLNPIDDGTDLQPGKVAFEGTLDYLQCPDSATAEIFDWKSFYQIIDADTFQSKLYPLLVFQHFPDVEVVRFHLQFVRYGATRSVEYLRSQDLEKLKQLALRARSRQLHLHTAADLADYGETDENRAIGETEVEPMPGAHCAWCPLLMKGCPIAAINPYTNQSPEDRARFAVWLNAAKKQNDAVLKDLVNAGGPITVQDANGKTYEAGFQLQEKNVYPLVDCYTVIVANDQELASKLTISGLPTPLKAKKRAALAELLATKRVTKASTRFAIRGVEGDDEDEE